MHVHVSHDAAASVATGALVVPVFAGTAIDGAAAEVDRALGGAIADVLASGEIVGKLNETSLVHAKDHPFKRVLVVGLGERAKLRPSMLAKYAGTAVRHLGKRGVEQVAFVLPAGLDGALAASFVAEGALAATIDTTTYRTEPDRPVKTTEVAILAGGYAAEAVEAGRQARRGTRRGDQQRPPDGPHPGQRHDSDRSGGARPRAGRRTRGWRSTCSTKPAWRPRAWARCWASRAARTSRPRSRS